MDHDMAMNGAAAGIGFIALIIQLVIMVGVWALMWWKVFQKAGQPGWAAVVPIYNVVTLLKIAGKPWWWVVLLFIPIANIAAIIYLVFVVPIAVAKAFGKDTGFGIGLIFLAIIFYPILGFGSAQYQGPVSGGAPAPAV